MEIKIPKKISAPKHIGCGTWYCIHTLSLKLDKRSFIKALKAIIEGMKCSKCKYHATLYMSENDPYKQEAFHVDGRNVAMFFWGWRFHETVNKRIGKSPMSFDRAYQIYSSDMPCTKNDCDDTSSEEEEDNTNIRSTRVPYGATRMGLGYKSRTF